MIQRYKHKTSTLRRRLHQGPGPRTDYTWPKRPTCLNSVNTVYHTGTSIHTQVNLKSSSVWFIAFSLHYVWKPTVCPRMELQRYFPPPMQRELTNLQLNLYLPYNQGDIWFMFLPNAAVRKMTFSSIQMCLQVISRATLIFSYCEQEQECNSWLHEVLNYKYIKAS